MNIMERVQSFSSKRHRETHFRATVDSIAGDKIAIIRDGQSVADGQDYPAAVGLAALVSPGNEVFVLDLSGKDGYLVVAKIGDGAPTRTRTVELPMGSFVAQVGAPTFARVKSRVAAWSFDDSVVEVINGAVGIPLDYDDGGLFRLFYVMDTAVAGDVRWEVAPRSVIEGEDYNAGSPATGGTTVNDPVQGTASFLGVVEITPTGMTYEPDDRLAIEIVRHGNNGADTAVGDAYLVGIEFEYTAILW